MPWSFCATCSRRGKHGRASGPVTPNASVRGIAFSLSISDSPDSALGAGEVGVRVLQYDIDVLRCSGSIA